MLQETIDYYHISQSNLAERLGASEKYVSEILSRKCYMSEETALKLERILGISSKLLLNLDAAYRLEQAKKSLAKAEKRNKGKNSMFLKQYD